MKTKYWNIWKQNTEGNTQYSIKQENDTDLFSSDHAAAAAGQYNNTKVCIKSFKELWFVMKQI